MISLTKIDSNLVTTFDGREVPKEDCKRIDGDYYEMNVDCFLIETEKGELKWNRINNGRIAFDYENNKYDLTKRLREKEDYTFGIIDDKGTKGYFKVNVFKNAILLDNALEEYDTGTLCVNKDIAEKLGYIEYFGNGCYVKKGTVRNPQQKVLNNYKKVKKLSYNADEGNSLFLNVVKEYNKHKRFIEYSPNTGAAAKLLGNYSFGCELESSNGTIPYQLLGPLGLVPLKDGSLRDEQGREPYEYTTIPLSGEAGLETLKLACIELSKRCEFNEKCSLHVHIGGVKKRTEEFVIALYKLGFNIQKEVFQMFPDYKTNPDKWVKDYHKNYCQFLPDLGLNQLDFRQKLTPPQAKQLVKTAFDKIYWFASDQMVNTTDPHNFNLHSFQHPKGVADKWNYSSRYHWINFMRYIFHRSETIEFRNSTPTFNHTKTSNWLFISLAIVQFAEQFTNEILKDEVPYTLENILSCYKNNFFKSFYETDYNHQVANYLTQYCNFRKDEMKKCIEKNDGWGRSIEFKKDLDFSFNASGLNSIY